MTPADRTLLEALQAAVAAGKAADFDLEPWTTLAPTGTIPAELVRTLVLGESASSGVQILNVTIDGELDLRNARGPGGGAANTLKLQNCTLNVDDPDNRPALDACHSHLSRLSLIGCNANGLHLSSAVIDGDLILEGLAPVTKDGACWVRARGVRVGGSVNASAAELRSPTANPSCWKDASTRYAFDLYGANVGGSLELRRRFIAIGGLRLVLATIGGDIRAEGALLQGVDHVNSGDDDRCIRARGADIRGTIFLCCSAGPPHDRFEAAGIIDLDDAHVGVGVVAYGASLSRIDSGGALKASLTLVRARIDGGIWLTGAACADRFEASDPIDLAGVTVGAAVDIDGGTAIKLQDATIGGMVSVSGGPSLDAWDAVFGNSLELTVGGDVSLKGARVAGALMIEESSPGSVTNLDGTGIKVGRSLQLSVAGPVDVSNGTAGGYAEIEAGAGFTALNAVFESSLVLEVGGAVVLSGTRVAGDLTISNADNRVVTGLTAIGMNVGRDLTIHGRVAGAADFSSTVIDGNLRIGTPAEALMLDARNGLVEPELRLESARVRLAFEVEGVALVDSSAEQVRRSSPAIVLRGLRVGTLDDRDGERWPRNVQLELDGFEYDRTDRVAPATGSTAADLVRPDRVKSRRRWLIQGQFGDRVPTPDDYKPQPFEQLAKVWRSEGSHSEATKITFDRLDLERKVYDGPVFEDRVGPFAPGIFRGLLILAFLGFGFLLVLVASGVIPGDAWGSIIVIGFLGSGLLVLSTRALKWMFLQVPFGYGLKTSRALATLVALWIGGTFLVLAGTNAISGNVLKVDASTVGTVYSGTAVVVPKEPRAGDPEIDCGAQVDAMLYALDVMVPLLDLRQEQRCRVSEDASAWIWRLVKVTYAVLGWIVVSGLVLTASGFVRRQIER